MCEFCENGNDLLHTNLKSGRKVKAFIQKTEESGESRSFLIIVADLEVTAKQINYCPMCGEKVSEG